MNRFAAIGLLLTLGWGTQVSADNVALVIGNGDYDNAPNAQTAARDAEAVAEALEENGWTVTKGVNLDRAGMKALIEPYSGQVENAEKVLIFYSGHAFRSGGVTYLAPTDASTETLTNVMFDGVPLDLLLQLAGEKSGNAVVFIDGAQLRGFQPTGFVEPGLAALEGPEGVLIVSAAEPGHAVRRSSWRDSRFARLIVDRFVQPGASVREVAAAAPSPTFVAGDVDTDFMLVPEPEPELEGLEKEIELAYWRTAERSGDADDYKSYLDRYPNGTFAKFARERLGLPAEGEEVPKEPEVDPRILADRALGLSRARKRRVQEYLLAMGFDPRGIDGLFGRGSRNAIRRWQVKNGMDNEGWLTEEQLALLTEQGEVALEEQRRIAEEKRRIREAEDNAYWSATGANGTPAGYRTYLEKYPDGLHAKLARAALAKIAEAEADAKALKEKRAWARAQKRDTAESYRRYLADYPEGIYRDEALAKLDAIEGAERQAAEIARLEQIEAALNLSDQDRLSVEQRLRALSFEVGPLDGVFDDRSRAAIKGYQAARDINDTGYLDRLTVVTLVRETNQPQQGQVQIDGAQVIRGLLEALGKQ
jgi:peptidoglycan hydrolase-like protein with peptidoglycan-binding domain